MIHVINQKVPSCPYCASGMHHRAHNFMHENKTMFGTIYICNDCKSIFRVLGVGQTENEVIVGDNLNDDIDKGIEELTDEEWLEQIGMNGEAN